MPKTNKRDTPTEQVSRFIETARALGCDEDKERFEAALGKVAAHKPIGAPRKRGPGRGSEKPQKK